MAFDMVDTSRLMMVLVAFDTVDSEEMVENMEPNTYLQHNLCT